MISFLRAFDHIIYYHFFGSQPFLGVFVSLLRRKIQGNKMRRIDCVVCIYRMSTHEHLSFVSFSTSWLRFFIQNPSSTFSYIQAHRYLIGSRRLMASQGNTVKTHGDRRGWGIVGQPRIRRVPSPILVYLVKPMSWVEVYLVLRCIFVKEESALQVKYRL